MDGEIGPLAGDRAQIGGGRAPAFAVGDGPLIGAEAFLFGAVEILGHLIASADPGIDEGRIDGVDHAAVGHPERAFAAVIVVGPFGIAFGLPEIGQDVVIAPAREPRLAPLVVVAGMAADVDHPVDARRAAPAAAARPIKLAVVQMFLRLGVEEPVIVVGRLEQLADAGRHPHQQALVLLARLDETDRVARIGRKAIGEHAAGAARADDDIIEFGGFRGHGQILRLMTSFMISLVPP